MEEKIKVVHLINSVEPGGAGNLLFSQIPYINMNKYDIHIGFLSGEGNYFENFSTIQLIDFSSNTNFAWISIIKILLYVIKNKIDIVHTHLIQASILGRFVAFIVPGVKCVTTRHYARSKKDHRLINRFEDFTERYCHAIICISKYVRNHLIKIGIKKSKLHVIYNGIDINLFNLVILDNEYDSIIGTIGRLDKQKGVDILIKSFRKVLIKYPDVKLEIIGDGPQKDQLIQLVLELKLENQVTFYGKMAPKDVRKKICRWKAFVLASRWEAFGIVIVEANAIGLPVIATNVEAIPELIRDSVNGYLVAPENVTELSEKICAIFDYPDIAINMGKRGSEIVENCFSIKILIQKTENLYRNLLKKS